MRRLPFHWAVARFASTFRPSPPLVLGYQTRRCVHVWDERLLVHHAAHLHLLPFTPRGVPHTQRTTAALVYLSPASAVDTAIQFLGCDVTLHLRCRIPCTRTYPPFYPAHLHSGFPCYTTALYTTPDILAYTYTLVAGLSTRLRHATYRDAPLHAVLP